MLKGPGPMHETRSGLQESLAPHAALRQLIIGLPVNVARAARIMLDDTCTAVHLWWELSGGHAVCRLSQVCGQPKATMARKA